MNTGSRVVAARDFGDLPVAVERQLGSVGRDRQHEELGFGAGDRAETEQGQVDVVRRAATLGGADLDVGGELSVAGVRSNDGECIFKSACTR